MTDDASNDRFSNDRASDVLVAPHVLEYPYTRSTGPVIGTFLAGLGERRFFGVRGADGRVLVPPVEYDPLTAQELGEFVEVAETGTVTSWSWNPHPRSGQPLQRPFAWALVRLDGADTALLAAVDPVGAGGPEAMRTGMRVRARWVDDPAGTIHDLSCFEPEGAR